MWKTEKTRIAARNANRKNGKMICGCENVNEAIKMKETGSEMIWNCRNKRTGIMRYPLEGLLRHRMS